MRRFLSPTAFDLRSIRCTFSETRFPFSVAAPSTAICDFFNSLR